MILLALVVFGCAPTKVAPPRSPAPIGPDTAPHVVEDAADNERFCGALAAAIDSWGSGFATSREAGIGTERWRAPPLGPDLDRCVIDGLGGLATSYGCEASTPGPGDPGSTAALFVRLETLVDRCLAKPSWYPREWVKADPVRLAGGERQLLWRDQAAWPRPALQLKLEEDYGRVGRWRVHMLIYTMR